MVVPVGVVAVASLTILALNVTFPDGVCNDPVTYVDPNADYKGWPPTTSAVLALGGH